MGWLSDLWKYGFTRTQRARSRGAERYAQALAAYEQELADLPAADARVAAEQVLASPRFISVFPWTVAAAPGPELAPTLTEFFRRIQRVEVPGGERRADAAELEPLDWAAGYLRLGADGEHAHIAVRAGDEAIYVLADDAPSDDRVESVFATVYHWVLWLERSEELLAESDPPAA